MSECDGEVSIMRRPRLTRGCAPLGVGGNILWSRPLTLYSARRLHIYFSELKVVTSPNVMRGKKGWVSDCLYVTWTQFSCYLDEVPEQCELQADIL